jgi:hypothetical protein
MHVQFELEAGYPDALKSLEDRNKNIELVATRDVGDTVLATVYVPNGQLLSVFERKIQKYASKNTPSGHPAHQSLIAPIRAIRLAALHDFWTDDETAFPDGSAVARWEIWIRDDANTLEQFERGLASARVELSRSFLVFRSGVSTLREERLTRLPIPSRSWTRSPSCALARSRESFS